MSTEQEDIKLIKENFIAHAADDKLNFGSLVNLNSKTQLSMELMSKDIGYIKEDLKEIKDKLDLRYVSKEEFLPVQRITYGLTGLILTSVVIAIVTLVVK